MRQKDSKRVLSRHYLFVLVCFDLFCIFVFLHFLGDEEENKEGVRETTKVKSAKLSGI